MLGTTEIVEMRDGLRESCLFILRVHRVRCFVPPSLVIHVLTADVLRTSRLVYNGTFMVTNQSGSAASLTFNGTAVWLYGFNGKSKGEYQVTLDDNPAFVGNGFSKEDQFQQVLFEATGLDANKTHQLTVYNVGVNQTNYFVIDSVSDPAQSPRARESGTKLVIGVFIQIIHEVEVPDDYQDFREQDLSSSFEYSPSAWTMGLNGSDQGTGQ